MSDLLTDTFFSDMKESLGRFLNSQNYFSPDANRQYMSSSQLKSFLDCPARTIAELNGEYKREDTTALLVGSFVDAYFSGVLNGFKDMHPELYTGKKTLRAEYQQAEQIIEILRQDDLLCRMLSGQVQQIVTGEIAGVPFKGKLDSLLSAQQCQSIAEDYPDMAADLMMADGCICDLKCMRDMEPVWVPGAGKLSFIEAWRYDLQLAIYQKLAGGNLPCFIVCVTKEKQPDKALIRIPQYMMDAALSGVEPSIPAFHALKARQASELEQWRCGKCDYCRTTKTITGAMNADELEGAGL
jgi:hypothetical protein